MGVGLKLAPLQVHVVDAKGRGNVPLSIYIE